MRNLYFRVPRSTAEYVQSQNDKSSQNIIIIIANNLVVKLNTTKIIIKIFTTKTYSDWAWKQPDSKPYLKKLVNGPHCVKDNMKCAVLCGQDPNLLLISPNFPVSWVALADPHYCTPQVHVTGVTESIACSDSWSWLCTQQALPDCQCSTADLLLVRDSTLACMLAFSGLGLVFK